MVILLPYWNPTDRYLGPLYPLYLIYSWKGMKTLLRLTSDRIAESLLMRQRPC